jgi:copper chaperone CopZ
VDSIAVTYGLLGPFIAVVRPIAALITGVVGGTLTHLFGESNGDVAEASPTESSCAVEGCCDDGAEHRHTFADAIRYGFVILPRDIGRALLIGVVLSGVISALIAPDTLRAYLGGGLVPMLAAMAIGIPLYVCATASTPIAASLIVAGLSPGAALVFLITGPATNSAAITTLLKVLGRRSTVLYLLTVAVGALATGLAVDGIVASGLVPLESLMHTAAGGAAAHVHDHGKGVGWWVGQISAVALLLVMLNALRTPATASVGNVEDSVVKEPETVELEVTGMSCNHCVQSVTRALSGCAGVQQVEVELEPGSARITGDGLATDELLEAVDSLGFKAALN